MTDFDGILDDEWVFHKLKSKWIRIYAFSFLAVPVSYGIKLLASRELAVDDIWLIYGLLWFIGLISVYNDLWLTDALQYFLPKYIINKDAAKAKWLMYFTLVSQLISWLFLGILLFFLAPRLAQNYFHSPEAGYLLKYFWIYFFVINFFQVLQSFYFAVQHVKAERIIEFTRMTLVLISIVWFRQFWMLSLYTLAVGRVIGVSLTTLISARYFFTRYYKNFLSWTHSISSRDARTRIWYGFWSLIGANARTIFGQIDMQFILIYMGKESAWYRTNYMSLNSLSSYIFIPLLSFLFPVFTELAEKKQFQKIILLRKRLFISILWFWGIVGYIFHTRWEEIAKMVFSDKYLLSWEILSASAFLLMSPLLGIMNFQLLRSLGKVRIVTFIQIWIVLLHTLVSRYIIRNNGSLSLLANIFLLSHLLFFIITQAYISYNKNGWYR